MKAKLNIYPFSNNLIEAQLVVLCSMYHLENTKTPANRWLGLCVLGKASRRRPNANISVRRNRQK
jgi:hypothetical protein